MPFSWYYPDIPKEYLDAAEKRDQMYILELKERAALMMRMGFSQDETKLRLCRNIKWDFELHNEPKHLKKVDQIVENIYRMRGHGANGPPSLE